MCRRAATALFVVLFAACGGARTEVQKTAARRSSQARRVAREAGLSARIQSFLAHYAGAAGETFSVTYDVTAGSMGTSRIVVDQRPPQRRVDVRSPIGESSYFQLDSGGYACSRSDSIWSCQRTQQGLAAAPAALDAADIQRTAAQLKSAKDDFTFHVGLRNLAGTRATCLVTTPKPSWTGTRDAPAPKSLCLSPEGAPLLLETSAETLRAVRYAAHVDRKRLQLPAPPRHS